MAKPLSGMEQKDYPTRNVHHMFQTSSLPSPFSARRPR